MSGRVRISAKCKYISLTMCNSVAAHQLQDHNELRVVRANSERGGTTLCFYSPILDHIECIHFSFVVDQLTCACAQEFISKRKFELVGQSILIKGHVLSLYSANSSSHSVQWLMQWMVV